MFSKDPNIRIKLHYKLYPYPPLADNKIETEGTFRKRIRKER